MAEEAIGAGAGNGSNQKISFLGIKDEEKDAYKDFLQRAAATDFWHDFHHAKSAPILDRLGKSYNVNSGLSVRAYQAKVLDLRSTFQGATLYDMFKAYKSPLMLVDNEDAETLKYMAEDNVLNSILPYDNKYESIRNKLIQGVPQPPPALPEGSIDIEPLFIGPEGKQRPYRFTAVPVKNRGTFYDVAPSFSNVSKGTKNFILMIDASFLSMSKLLILAADPGTTYNFFIIQSIENEGDPATKIGNFDTSEYSNVNVYFLNDTGHKTYYTSYNNAGDASNLFSGCSISAYRDSDGTITADIKSDTIDTTIDNIGTASEPNEAGFLAFQKLITKENPTTDDAMVYYLLKRAGDWCQALCLLDRGRLYTINVYGNSAPIEGAPGPFTLEKIIQTTGPVEVALLTHDKILLSYALSMGLNVYYTIKVVAPGGDESSSSVIWLTYFKNTLDSDPDAIIKAANEKWETIQKDIAEIRTIFSLSAKDPIAIEKIDELITTYYNEIASTCIRIINANKEEENGVYKKGILTKFILSTRAVLDIACKIANKPEEPEDTIQSIIKRVLTAISEPDASTIFSIVSAAETKIHTYLQIAKYIKELDSINAEQIESEFSEELKKLQEIETVLQSDLPIIQKNKSYAESYQYFLLTIVPAIKKDLNEFIKRFDHAAEITNALTLDMTKYTLQGREIKSERKQNEWREKINTWYESYRKGLGLQAEVQQGGNTPYNIQVGIPLHTNKYIRTRRPFIPYNIDSFQTSFKQKLKQIYRRLTNLQVYLQKKAKELYELEEQEQSIIEPDLTGYISEVLGVYVEMLCSQIKLEESQLNEVLTDEWSTENADWLNEQFGFARLEVRPSYVQNDTTLDTGTTITYNDGLGYTLLNDCIITKEEIPEWIKYLTYPADKRNSLDLRASQVLFLRFLLFNLDLYTNKIHEVDTETIEEDKVLYIRRIKTVVDTISVILTNVIQATVGGSSLSDVANLALTTVLTQFDVSNGYLNEEQFPPSEEAVSTSSLLTDIAVGKVILILFYHSQIMIGLDLDDYQKVRLFLLLCPSIEDTDPYFNKLIELFSHESNNLSIAKIFQYIKYKNTFPTIENVDAQTIADYNARLAQHVLAYKDGFYGFAIEASKEQQQQQGGRKKRFQKTRSKPKIRKPTRRSVKKYRNKTKRISTILAF